MVRYYIARPGSGATAFERWHKRRQVWQWFYDSANPGWKTRGGAERALAKLAERWPLDFGAASVIKTD